MEFPTHLIVVSCFTEIVKIDVSLWDQLLSLKTLGINDAWDIEPNKHEELRGSNETSSNNDLMQWFSQKEIKIQWTMLILSCIL